VNPDGDTIASAGDDQLVRIWPLEPHRTLATTVGGRGFDELAGGRTFHLPDVWDLALGPRGMVAVAADDGGVLLFRPGGSARVPQPVSRIRTSDPAWAVAFRGDTLAVAAGPAFRLYDTGPSCPTMPASPCARGGSAAHPFHSDSIERVEFDRSGRVLASAGDDGVVNLWDVSRPGRVRHLGRLPGERVKILALAFDPAADVLAVGDDVGRIGLWRVGDPSHPAPLGGTVVGHEHQSVDSLAFSPDGGLLASGGEDQQVALWQVDPRRGITKLPQSLSQSNSILAVAFSPDGKVLAAGDGDGSTCLYDVASLRFIGTTDCLLSDYSSTANLSGIRRVAFAPDGKTLFTAGTATPVVAWSSLLWSLDRGAEDRLAGDVCRIAGRNLTAGEWHLAFANTPIADHRRRTCSRYPLR
jgi:WD40 repeat protein